MTKTEKENQKISAKLDYDYYKSLLMTTEICRNWTAYMLYKNPNCRHGEKNTVKRLIKQSDSLLNILFNKKLNRKQHTQTELDSAKEYLEDGADFHCESFMLSAVVPDDLKEEYLKAQKELIEGLIQKSRA